MKKLLILLLATAIMAGAQSLSILNSEADLASAETEYAVTKDYSKKWKSVDGKWVEQVYKETKEADENGEGQEYEANWKDRVAIFDYRFLTGETPIWNGGHRVITEEGFVKIVKAHDPRQQEEWEVVLVGFEAEEKK